MKRRQAQATASMAAWCFCTLIALICVWPLLILGDKALAGLKRGLMACGLGPRRWFRGAQPAAMHRRVISEEGGCHD